jgi:hypothetical protein
MRNPLARLVHRDDTKPSLRERAASLKASASRVIRRKSVADAAWSPAQYDPIFNLIDEHRAASTEWRDQLVVFGKMQPGTEGFEAAAATDERTRERGDAAFEALLAAQPTSLGGLLALAKYLPGAFLQTGLIESDEPAWVALRTVCQSVLQQAGALIEERDPVLDLIAAHERAYGQRLFCSAYKPGTSAERQAIQAEERAYRAILHSPLSTDGGRVAYATAVFNREMHKPTPRLEDLGGRDHPLAVAGRNLSLGEYAREEIRDGRLAGVAVSPFEEPHSREATTVDPDADLITLGWRFDEERDAWLALVPASRDALRRVREFEASVERISGRKPTFADHAAAWAQPGVKEAHEQEDKAHERFSRVLEAIRATPARTPAGLAVKARALIPAIWPDGKYQEDAALGRDEDWVEAGARDLIEACCKLAGVDWQGRGL